jgi:DNA-3-methyladenine glycosylase
MFGPPGFSYVYFCYGNHYLFNVVTEPEGIPGGILIRALEPVKGMEIMAKRRKQTGLRLSNGPGKLTQALGISRGHSQIPVWKRPLSIQAAPRKETVGVTTRIGITEGWELPLRFYLKGNPYLSVKPGQDRPSQGRKKQLKEVGTTDERR